MIINKQDNIIMIIINFFGLFARVSRGPVKTCQMWPVGNFRAKISLGNRRTYNIILLLILVLILIFSFSNSTFELLPYFVFSCTITY